MATIWLIVSQVVIALLALMNPLSVQSVLLQNNVSLPLKRLYFNKLVCFDQFLGDLQGWRDERGSLLEGLLVFSDKIFGQYESQSWTFGNLKEDNNFADVTLVCEDGQQVEAHKVILAGDEHKRFMLLNWNCDASNFLATGFQLQFKKTASSSIESKKKPRNWLLTLWNLECSTERCLTQSPFRNRR